VFVEEKGFLFLEKDLDSQHSENVTVYCKSPFGLLHFYKTIFVL
jgi:hypothetical protein